MRISDSLDHVSAPSQARVLIRKIMRSAGEEGRDAVVRALAHSDQWFHLLPDVIDSKMWTRTVKVISPEEYISKACNEDFSAGGKRQTEALVVNGDVDIMESRGGRVFVSGHRVQGSGKSLVVLPDAVVRGDLRISGMKELREVLCTVTGDTALQQCHDLEKIQGEYFGDMRISECGVEFLDAGYRCGRNLRVSYCENLKVINCEVARDLIVTRSPVKRTGSGLRVGGDIVFTGGEEEPVIRGEIRGGVSKEGRPLTSSASQPRTTLRKGQVRATDREAERGARTSKL